MRLRALLPLELKTYLLLIVLQNPLGVPKVPWTRDCISHWLLYSSWDLDSFSIFQDVFGHLSSHVGEIERNLLFYFSLLRLFYFLLDLEVFHVLEF